ncbi:MAG: helix-turn-helix transcriptional regulator [Magnetococcales bacterium]|nr:helix-turn-helix transcriptional regulator [Magnetococcales bacterium]
MASPIGEKIRGLRKQKGYTLDQLAELCDTSKSRIWELENRDSVRPTANKLGKLSEALGVTLEYLMSDDNSPPEDEVVDQAFYREYKKMPTDTKKKIREMVRIWSDE